MAATGSATAPVEDPFLIRPKDLAIDARNQRTLYNSNFLKFYDVIPRQPDPLEVIKHLGEVTHASQVEAFRTLFRESRAHSEDSDARAAYAAVKHWSSGGDVELPPEDVGMYPPLFKAVNRALITDDVDKLPHFTWFIRALNSHLTNTLHSPQRCLTTWRGSKMDSEQAAMLVEGTVVRPCMYVASSLDRNVGEVFCGEARNLLKLTVPSGCRNASVISRFARIQDEKEVLIPPYSPMLVKRVSKQGNYNVFEMDVLDGMVYREVERGGQNAELLIDQLPRSICGKHARACVV
jgi:hypothetical protein